MEYWKKSGIPPIHDSPFFMNIEETRSKSQLFARGYSYPPLEDLAGNSRCYEKIVDLTSKIIIYLFRYIKYHIRYNVNIY